MDMKMTKLLMVLIIAFSAHAVAQSAPDILRARILYESNPYAGVRVVIRGTISGIERTARSDANGIATVVFPDGEGSYEVTVKVIGFKPITQRVERQGTSTIISFTLTLQKPEVHTLAAVDAQGAKQRNKVTRSEFSPAEGGQRNLNKRDQKRLFSLNPSDLTSGLRHTPGVVYTPGINGESGRFRVLGASADDNVMLLNGSRISTPTLPEGIVQNISLSTTSFDVSHGQFSGGQLSATTRRAGNLRQGVTLVSFSHPDLSWQKSGSAATVPARLSLNGRAEGPIIFNRLFYVTGLEWARSSTETPSLVNIKSSLLQEYGISSDSISYLSDLLVSKGIPLQSSRFGRTASYDRYSAYVGLHSNISSVTGLSLTMAYSGHYRDGQQIGQLNYPATSGRETSSNLSVAGSFTHYVASILNTTTVGYNSDVSNSRPYTLLPLGVVSVGNPSHGINNSLINLGFGGSSTPLGRNQNSLGELRQESSWFSMNGRHKVKASGIVQVYGISRETADAYGRYVFQSLQDIAADSAISYSRTFSASRRNVRTLAWGMSIGDEWQAHRKLLLQYGLRLDGGQSLTKPVYNPMLDSTFGLRTDRVPDYLTLSPRVGFAFGNPDVIFRDGGMTRRKFLGQFLPVGLIGAKYPITLSGGIGAFRGVIHPDNLLQAASETGLPGSVRQLTCIGGVVPVPRWSTYLSDPSAIPEQCNDGTGASYLSNNAPGARVYAGNFKPPVQWRANLELTGTSVLGWDIDFGATYVLGRNNQSSFDVNLDTANRFFLANEGGRTVYSDPTLIVSNSGLIPIGANRNNPGLGRVLHVKSDLKSRTLQGTISIFRNIPFWEKLEVHADYTYLNVRRQNFGGGGLSQGDVLSRSWVPGDVPSHMIFVGTYYPIKSFTLAVGVKIQSGYPFTPIVSGDINGDGMTQNDIAYIFDPSVVSDPSLREGMEALLASAPSRARSCLRRQIGSVAKVNSCNTGWLVSPDLKFFMRERRQTFDLTRRIRFELGTENILSAILRLTGLDNTGLARSTNPAFPNPVLLNRVGFDPVQSRFNYVVNSSFGEPFASQPKYNLPPVRLHLKATMGYGGLAPNNLAHHLGFIPDDKKTPYTREFVEEAARGLNVNPMVAILENDSLALTPFQRDKIVKLAEEFNEKIEVLYRPIVDILYKKRGKVFDRELIGPLNEIRTPIRDLMNGLVARLPSVLHESQIELLPEYMRNIIEAEVK